ncbi:hypothetical protein K9K85_00205 [Patescibacteria group bacterium]|nr:hypothetical protein [Patescibacteria group bacterium]
MYFYIYDSFLVKKKYAKTLSKIETRLASLDISGHKHSLSILKSVDEIIRKILERDSSPTIVVVGGDETLCQSAPSLVGTEATLGFIPTEKDSLLAEILGLPVNEYACDVVSARRIENINLGKINSQYFFSSLEFDPRQSLIMVDKKYQIIPRGVKKAKIINLGFLSFQKGVYRGRAEETRLVSKPQDNYLELLMGTSQQKVLFWKQKEKKDSLFFIKKMNIDPREEKRELLIRVDQRDVVKAPALVEIAKEKLRIIVGKDRLI